MASILETVSMVAEFGQQRWSCMNFQCSDRTLRSRDIIFEFSHKSRAAWAFRSLEVYMSENQHIYEDLNESSSARPGGSQQLEILPSPNRKRTPNFSTQILARRRNFTSAEISTSAIVLSYVWIFTRRLNSVYPPKFCEAPKFSARIFRLNFPQKFSA